MSVTESKGIGLGMVIQNHLGQVMVSGTNNTLVPLDSIIAEGLVIIFVLQVTLDTSFTHIQVETDYLNVINALSPNSNDFFGAWYDCFRHQVIGFKFQLYLF